MKPIEVEIKTNHNDWMQLLVDGEIVIQGHNIDAGDTLDVLEDYFNFSYKITEASFE